MKTVTKTATEARNEFFDLILAAKYGGQVTIVTKNGNVAAQISPPNPIKKPDWKKINEAMKALGGTFTDEDVKIIRKARIDSRKNRYPDW